MTITATTNLSLPLITTGTESGTWGDVVDNGLTSYLDIAIAGGLAITVTTTDVTLTNTAGTSSATNIGSTSAQYAILNVSGAMTAAHNLIVPSSSKYYIINNATTGGYVLTVKGSATSGVGLVNGEKALVAWNGTDYVKISGQSGSGTFYTVTATAPTAASSNLGAFNYGTLSFSDTGIVQSAQTSVNSYFQNVIQNTSAGTAASAEFIAYNDQGTASTNYATVGINSSGYSGTGSINAPGYAYFLSASTDLVLGTIGANGIHFTINSSATDALAISSAGAVSLPGGTANGVAYLNGSKVVTTGSALTFTGTAFAVNSIAPGVGINDTTATVGVSYSWLNGGAVFSYGQIGLRDNTNAQTAYSYSAGASGYHNWYQNGSEQMRLTSTGLGIGTSSPSYALDVQKSIASGVIANFQSTNTSATYTGIAFRSAASSANARNWSLTMNNNAFGDFVIRTSTANGGDPIAAGVDRLVIDSSGNLGIGTSSPSELLTVAGQIGSRQNINSAANVLVINSNAGASANARFRLASDVVTGNLQANSNAATPQLALVVEGAYPLTFYTTNTERMRLDSSGNLGIGTTNTGGAKLYISGGALASSPGVNGIAISGNLTTGRLVTQGTGGLQAIHSFYDASSLEISQGSTGAQSGIVINGPSATNNPYTLQFFTSGSEKMRLDTSGNLGLGVTPSAWGSNFRALQLPNGSALWNPYSGTGTALGANVYQDATNEKYIATDSYATQYKQVSGQHQWKTAGSGTAGNAITFTQAMTLSAAGVLSLGDTGTVASSFAGVKFNGASYNGLGLNDSSSTSAVGFVYFQIGGTTIGSITRVAATSAVAYNTVSDQRLK